MLITVVLKYFVCLYVDFMSESTLKYLYLITVISKHVISISNWYPYYECNYDVECKVIDVKKMNNLHPHLFLVAFSVWFVHLD